MDECCGPPPDIARRRAHCPSCGQGATVVEPQTVKALVTEAGLRRFEVDAYYFCSGPNCDIVYFSRDDRRFSKNDLRVAVWQKEPAGHRTVCYCFGENEADIRREIEQTGASAAVSRVRAHIAARRCACEIRNPRGTCCLGDLRAAAKRVETSLQSAVSR